MGHTFPSHRTVRDERNRSAGTAAIGLAAALVGTAAYNQWRTRAAEAADPPAGDFVEIDGVRIHYVDQGSGPPVVLLHGNGVTLQDWQASGVLQIARERFRVVAFDRPGFGYTDRPRTTAWTPEVQAELLFRAFGALGIKRPVVVGHSWGALAAVAMALEYPADLAGLVLISGYYFATARPDVALFSPPAVPLLGDVLAHTVSPLAGRLLLPGAAKASFAPAPVDERFMAMRDMMLRPTQIRAASADAALMTPAALAMSRRYAELRLPMHVLAGEGDLITHMDEHAEKLANTVQGATLRRFPGLGHLLHYARPADVVDSIDAVLRAA